MQDSAVETAPRLPDGLPDDWRYDANLPCLECGYNLRMQRLPRCPECGVVFRWQERLQVACARCGEYLGLWNGSRCPRCELTLAWSRLLVASPMRSDHYEYSLRPRARLLPSLCAALWPPGFWQGLVLEAAPVPARLRPVRYGCIAVCMIGVAVLAWASMRSWGAAYDLLFTTVPFMLTLALLLPLLTTIALPLFTPTLTRFRIRSDQLLRVSTYGFVGCAVIGVFLTGCASIVELGNRIAFSPWDPWRFESPATISAYGVNSVSYWTTGLLLTVGYAWWWLYLGTALGRYLRLGERDAFALFLSTQLIGLLVQALVLVAVALVDATYL